MRRRMAKTQKESLTPGKAQRIVVANTPDNPSTPPAPNTILKTLGVVDKGTATIHKAGIQSDLDDMGWTITQSSIKSSPTTTIAACRDSVLTHAK